MATKTNTPRRAKPERNDDGDAAAVEVTEIDGVAAAPKENKTAAQHANGGLLNLS